MSGDIAADSGRGVPKVSVIVVTYNHEDYICEALDSIVAQMTDFPFEIVVADDASTDRTPEIIRDYADRFPDLISPILRARNVGVVPNSVDARCRSTGRYIAACDGDDYWTDPLKLQKQVAVFDAHPEVALCFHPARVTWTDGREPDYEYPRPEWRDELSMYGLLKRNFIAGPSVMFRRQDWYRSMPPNVIADQYIYVRQALEGDIVMLPDVMAVYRRHPGAIWANVEHDRNLFWQGERVPMMHASTFEELLRLFPDDQEARRILCDYADWTLKDMAYALGDEGIDILLTTISEHPLFAAMALAHRWSI